MTDTETGVQSAPRPAAPVRIFRAIRAGIANGGGGLAGWSVRHACLVLTLLCLLLWLPGVLSLPALDRDESRFAQSSRQMLDSGNFVDIRFGQVPRYKKPVGIYWLQSVSTAVAGLGDHRHVWTYRLPSLLGGMAAVWLTFWCALALTEAGTALVAALLMASTILLTAEATIATTDAVLLATVLGMQGVLLRIYRSARDALAPRPSMRMVMAGWACLAAGILVKGPVAPAIAIVTIVGLLLWDRLERRPSEHVPATPAGDVPVAAAAETAPPATASEDAVSRPVPQPVADARWLARLRPAPGLLLLVLLVAPWLVAITIQSQGEFFQQSLGNDFAAKIAGGQESHGAPPGYFLLTAAISFWPAILFVLPGLGLAVARRADPGIRFLLAWAMASWMMFEAVPTKLPHYVLPAYPALAILAAIWLVNPAGGETGWRRFLPWVSALQFLLGLIAVAGAAIWLPGHYGGITGWPVLVAACAIAVSGLLALSFFLAGRRRVALGAALIAAAVAIPVLTAGIGPHLERLWVSERLAALVAQHQAAGDPAPGLAGYTEPSLVFALGADVGLTDGAGAAERGADKGGLALIEDAEQPRFLARLAELQANATALDELAGFNYSRGRDVHITLYRVAPLQPVMPPKVQ